MQLGVGRARHHAVDFADPVIGPDRAGAIRQAKPDRPLPLHQPPQRAIVDDFVGDGTDPARVFQRSAFDQHAAARGGGHRAALAVHQSEGIEHGEKEHEGGNQKAFEQIAAMQLRHQRGEHQTTRFRPRHQLAQIIRCVRDIGIGEPEIGWRMIVGCVRDTLVHRPQFSRPAGRPGGTAEHDQAIRMTQRARDCARPIIALVVHQHDMKGAGIILCQQAGQRGRNHIGFVAGRNDGRDGRPGISVAGGGGKNIRIPFAGKPEPATAEQQIKPDRRREQRQCGGNHLR